MASEEKKDHKIHIEFPAEWSGEQRQEALDYLAQTLIEHGVDPGQIPEMTSG